MRITLVTGGARSGKSRWAEDRARSLGGEDVTFLATAEPRDEEMARRIIKHQMDRPPAWTTVEEPLRIGEALGRTTTSVVLLDCLTLFVSNVLLEQESAGVESATAAVKTAVMQLLEVAGGRGGSLVIVTNEVGFGIVPALPIARWYRDALGDANRRIAAIAEDVVLMLSGVPVVVKGTVTRTHPAPAVPVFDAPFRARLDELLRWRRDVRRFRSDPVEEAVVDELIGLATLAPSVGNSQPWRFVTVNDEARRAAVIRNFEACNAVALNDYESEQAILYASLKLAGLREAPVHLAVFCDTETDLGQGLGTQTMPETLRYSVVGAITTLWLAARARGIGVGWVSIVEPKEIGRILDVPNRWALIAYLCIGYPTEEHTDPELARAGWQERVDAADMNIRR